jgi:hypothetical protein
MFRRGFASTQLGLVGVLIGLTGFLIIILSNVKVLYLETGSRWAIDGLATIFSYSFINWIFPWLPNKLLSVGFILGGIFPVVVSLIFTSYAFYINSIIRDAARQSRVARMVDSRSNTNYRQSVERIHAGGNVTVTQIANAHKLEEWTNSLWKGPFGALILTVVAIIIAAVFTKLTGLTP